MPEGGVTAKLRGSLESYLARSAAELDERGATLAERAAELETESTELDTAETGLGERRRARRAASPSRAGARAGAFPERAPRARVVGRNAVGRAARPLLRRGRGCASRALPGPRRA